MCCVVKNKQNIFNILHNYIRSHFEIMFNLSLLEIGLSCIIFHVNCLIAFLQNNRIPTY